jgi:hypothetical protein
MMLSWYHVPKNLGASGDNEVFESYKCGEDLNIISSKH